jgi:hypothetical protein
VTETLSLGLSLKHSAIRYARQKKFLKITFGSDTLK